MNSSLDTANIVFWDFDGVIKDSINVKSTAYEKLFLPFGSNIAKQVREHHENNGGVSRFEKIPLYLMLSGEVVTQSKIDDFCNQFSTLVFQGVIDSPWVPGVRDYILRKFTKQYFVLITATPQEEIEKILLALDIGHCFREVYGAPMPKERVIKEILLRRECMPDQALVVGDSETDMAASQANSVPFLLRLTPYNLHIQCSHAGPTFENLIYE